MRFSAYQRTDLAIEEASVLEPCPGIRLEENEHGSLRVTDVKVINEQGAEHIHRSIGRYLTVTFPSFWQEDTYATLDALKQLLAEKLCDLFDETQPPRRILVVGLGNRAVTADAIGPFAADRIAVNGHLEKVENTSLPACRLFSFTPGVCGNTGMETLSLIQGALSASGATHLIAVDALASLSEDRLGKTVQLTDTGITPGSGVGNHRAAICQDTLGVPVIAIGVPLIVSSSTLVCNALEKAGIETLDEKLEAILENGINYFVTPKDCDLICDLLASAIADAVNIVAERFSTLAT